MKVLHVIPAVAPRYGGPSSVALGLARALGKLGVDVRVATTSADGSGHLRVPLGIDVEHLGVPTIFFRRSFSESYKYSLGLGAWLKRNVGSYDLVHMHAVFSHASIAAARACRERGVPYIIRPIGSLYPWALRHHRVRKELFLALTGKRMLASAAAVHYSSEDEKSFAESGFRLPRGFVTSLGVDDEIFTNASAAQSDPYVLFAGRWHVVKRLEWLITAFAAARTDGWRLVIAGEGSQTYGQQLKELASARGIRGAVEFVGWKSGEEKRRLISGAAVAALVSSQENFGVFAAEAMAAGVPVVVAAEVGLSADVVKARAGWVVTDGRLEETLAAAMTNADERRRRGAAARSWADQHYRWESVARLVVREYQSLGRQS